MSPEWSMKTVPSPILSSECQSIAHMIIVLHNAPVLGSILVLPLPAGDAQNPKPALNQALKDRMPAQPSAADL
ncbi:hypothetical protein N7456_002620 [Penicillium angulare]|uniref:Uncharacterized protein n=1 Tax=Penicillium angulare TaxID=116970 RepID=A0A9W9G8J7_9EURO|nr:hypothetical protein N7456_002620 [Penicillium angulare]